jgi:chromosome segregation ATPase
MSLIAEIEELRNIQTALAARVAALTKENELLRNDEADALQAASVLRGEVKRMQTENEQLRAVLSEREEQREARDYDNMHLRHKVHMGESAIQQLQREIGIINKLRLEETEQLRADRRALLAELVSVKSYAMGAVNVANRTLDARDHFSPENDPFNEGGTLKKGKDVFDAIRDALLAGSNKAT